MQSRKSQVNEGKEKIEYLKRKGDEKLLIRRMK